MANATILYNAILRALDSGNVETILRNDAYSLAGSVCQYTQGQTVAPATPITLPATTISVVMIRCLTSSAVSLIVTWTPSGGASAVVATLPAGSFLLLFQPSSGITALTLDGSAGTATYDMILGA